MQEPAVFILFGATGDLVAKKIVPAFYELFRTKQLPEKFRIIGASRRPIRTEEFQERIIEQLAKHTKQSPEEASIREFTTLFSFQQVQFEEVQDYQALAHALNDLDVALGSPAHRLIYLAVPPEHFPTIFTHLHASGIAKRHEVGQPWVRVLVEKPFGLDGTSGKALNDLLDGLVDESQVYCIDHYLAKETMQSLFAARFQNEIFAPWFEPERIERIHIRLWETAGVEHRGPFYDQVGTLRDVGQNHLLLMLALTTMERPATMTATDIRMKRAELLKKLAVMTSAEIVQSTHRAQYQGYCEITGVKPDSMTETSFRIETHLADPRWAHVPIVFESGKRMSEQRKEIVMSYRGEGKNQLTISFEPREGLFVDFQAKRPGMEVALEPRSFDFLLRPASAHVQYVAEYEKLLFDAIRGDQTLFVSREEVEAMWRFVDPIRTAWDRGDVPLETYETKESKKE